MSLPAFLDPATFTPWTAVGFAGQALFFSRFAVQWIASERRKQSHVPVAFWWLSLLGSLITHLLYRMVICNLDIYPLNILRHLEQLSPFLHHENCRWLYYP